MKQNQDSLTDVILWAALFSSNFIFLALTFTLPSIAISSDELLSQAAFIFGIAILAFSFVIPKLMKNADKRTVLITSLALNEQCSIMAFLTSYLWGNQTISYALFALSILGFLLKFPKPKKTMSKIDA